VNAFSHLSLLIDLENEKWWPEPAAFTDTANYFPRRSRRLLHESLHYWQQLSQGYLFLLAEEDWTDFLEHERTGKPATGGPRRKHFRQPEGQHGLSAWNVSESLTQFWEIFLIGREAANAKAAPLRSSAPDSTAAAPRWTSDDDFDGAMLASRDYSEPFRLARRLIDPAYSLIIFPFLAHFALKTRRPAHFFERFITEVAAPAGAKVRESGLLDPHSGPGPSVLYPYIGDLCAGVAADEGEPGLLHAPDLFASSPLRGNPAYVWSFQRVEHLSARCSRGAPLDVAICVPTGSHRGILALELTPPCLRFADGSPLALAFHYLEQTKKSAADELTAAKEAAAACCAVQTRAEELLQATRGY
jgi:hypothetical protein